MDVEQLIPTLAQETNRLKEESQAAAFETMRKIVGVTTAVFGTEVRIKESYDPEFPNERYVVLCAEVDAEGSDILRMESEWVKRVADISPNWHGFRLRVNRKK